MRIERLAFRDFRNYGRFELDGIGELTIFTGPNAVGKTNVLEGIQLLTSASSFRNPQISQLVREGTTAARLSMGAGDGNRALDVALSMEAGKRRYSVNGKARPAADVRGLLPSVMFTPDDMQLVKRSSSVKRAALDDLGVQLARNYYVVRRDYEKTVRYKNRLLHEEAPRDLLESINETLVTCGAQLYYLRRALFERIVPHVARVYAQLAGGGPEGFSAVYVPSWDRIGSAKVDFASAWGGQDGLGGPAVSAARGGGEDAASPPAPSASSGSSGLLSGTSGSLSRDEAREVIAFELAKWMAEERRRARSLVGPHNDGISFMLDGRDASAFASQGQQRSIVLAWKLAEAELVREVLGIVPVLLLDDVLSELDGTRREMLVRFVTSEVQTFVTATDLDGFAPEMVERARVVELPTHAGAADGGNHEEDR